VPACLLSDSSRLFLNEALSKSVKRDWVNSRLRFLSLDTRECLCAGNNLELAVRLGKFYRVIRRAQFDELCLTISS